MEKKIRKKFNVIMDKGKRIKDSRTKPRGIEESDEGRDGVAGDAEDRYDPLGAPVLPRLVYDVLQHRRHGCLQFRIHQKQEHTKDR